jgi:hypothetical protein
LLLTYLICLVGQRVTLMIIDDLFIFRSGRILNEITN